MLYKSILKDNTKSCKGFIHELMNLMNLKLMNLLKYQVTYQMKEHEKYITKIDTKLIFIITVTVTNTI